ncbi:hypothetical protein WN944_023893 [Citrus x changshan-huyou]|uniref:Uncharacterized protein n=1 Tax=Citrus x changshan-huyou TaxID=2935761 RepID=A0AAP0LLY6_9ROSI
MSALRFKTCRLLSGNVRKRELTIIQRRILRRLRKKMRSIKRKIYPRENLNSYIQSQTTRKLPLFHGDLPITEMHRGTEQTTRKMKVFFLEIMGNFIIPVVIFSLFLYVFGIPLIAFCDTEDGETSGSSSGEISGSSSAHKRKRGFDLNSTPAITEEKEIRGAIDLNKTPLQLDVEAQLLQRHQLEMDETRASIRAWVDWKIRKEMEAQGGTPLVGPIENLDEEVSTVITYGPQPKNPSNLSNVRRCLSILNNALWSEKDSPLKIKVEKAIVDAVRLFLVDERERKRQR